MHRGATWLAAILLLAAQAAFAVDPPPVLWTVTYRGERSSSGHSLALASDGGYVGAGRTGAASSRDHGCLMLKVSATGDTLWHRAFIQPGVQSRCRSLVKTADGGYALAGTRYPRDTMQPYLIKTNAAGTTEWDSVYPMSGDELGYSVCLTTDGGLLVGGIVGAPLDSTGFFVIQVDSNGHRTWNRVFRETLERALWWDYYVPVVQTPDGGIVVALFKDSTGLRLLKLDGSGNTEWDRTYLGYFVADPFCIQSTSDGGLIVTGAGLSPSEPQNRGKVYLLRTDSAGNAVWCRKYGDGLVNVGYWVEQTSDHGYVVAGYREQPEGHFDGYIVRTDSMGKQRWTMTYDGGAQDEFKCIKQTADGAYVVVGSRQDSISRCLMMAKVAPDAWRR